MRRMLVTVLALAALAGGAAPAGARSDDLGPDVIGRVAQALADRRVDAQAPDATRGLADLFERLVHAVPFVVSRSGTGSAVVVEVSRADATALVITNHHVVEDAFQDERGTPFVVLLFYDPPLASERFRMERVVSCSRDAADTSAWCQAFRRSRRKAIVLATDPSRDLALLAVSDVPRVVDRVPAGPIETVRTGDGVAVIGHPLSLLWSLTTGIVSAVRPQFLMGNPPHTSRSTVIQTQAPVNPGNSGGPLLTGEGRLIGVMFAVSLMPGRAPRARAQEEADVPVPAQGLNLAVGVDEVLAFTQQAGRRARPR